MTDAGLDVRDDDAAILREDDPRVAELLGDGWSVAGTSWGARLVVADRHVELLGAAVREIAPSWRVVRLGPGDAPLVADLERSSIDDYPYDSAATFHAVVDPEVLAEHLAADWRAYGAIDAGGALGSVTVMRPDGERIETEFTVTRAESRRLGLASAVKAFGILDHVELGHRVFGTGGHSSNVASIRVNERLGYVLEPRWLSLRRP